MERKALIIGLDGVPCTLLDEYIGAGRLPNIKRIISEGFALSQMDASIPDVSSTSWTSFMTGVNPGEHGIFGFMELRPWTYKLYFPNSGDIKAPAIWEIIGNSAGASSTLSEKFKGRFSGKRSVVLNVPQTYPARPLNGVLSAGFVCPDLKKGTYPESAYDYLSRIGYIPDLDSAKAAADPEGFFSEAFLSLERRREAYEHYLRAGDYSLFIGVVTETDRLHHFFFDAARDEKHPFHQKFISFYTELDELIGSLYGIFMEATGGAGLFMTMSDHGFTVIKKEFYMNIWLKQKGLLKLDTSKEYFEQIGAGTTAFALDPARVYLNKKGFHPLGAVADTEAPNALREIKEMLVSIKDEDGSPVVKEVHDSSEIYSGPYASAGPGLVCIAHDGFDLKGTLRKESVFGVSHFRGMHTRHDAHCIMPASSTPRGRLDIEDLAVLMLEHLA